MSTHACFEHHKEQGKAHEERVAKLLQALQADPRAATVPVAEGQAGADAEAGLELRAPAKTLRLALAQQRLALREFREAARLRPRDLETRQRGAAARAALRRLQAALEAPRARPMRRFLAHYNLSIRYWDLGKAPQALEEAERACEELRKAGLPGGCAEHSLLLMAQAQAEHAAEQRRLQEAVRRTPEAVGPNYKLGELYFDKRMLLRAEAQLKRTRELARAHSSLQLVELERQRQMPVLPAGLAPAQLALGDRRAERMAGLLEELEDDLEFLAGLRELWCVEEEAGKAEELQATGIRDGARPRLLPCLRRRCSAETQPCDDWWHELCRSTDISLHALPPRRAAA